MTTCGVADYALGQDMMTTLLPTARPRRTGPKTGLGHSFRYPPPVLALYREALPVAPHHDAERRPMTGGG